MLGNRALPYWNLESADPPPRRNGAGAGVAAVAAAVAWFGGVPGRVGAALLAVAALAHQRRAANRSTAERVESLLSTLEARDRYTASHCSRVGAFADLIAEELGSLDADRLCHLRIAAVLHDLGKLDVPLAILCKPGRLDRDEWTVMRRHAHAGAERAASLHERVRTIIAQHHERPDGRGYPLGLAGEAVCVEARIVAVADAFDAMTSNRPYRKALAPAVALAELRRAAGLDGESRGTQFDPGIVAAFTRRFDEACLLCTAEATRHASPQS